VGVVTAALVTVADAQLNSIALAEPFLLLLNIIKRICCSDVRLWLVVAGDPSASLLPFAACSIT
jgi:hypothetical protein